DAPEDCSLPNKGKSDGLVPKKGNLSSNEARDCTFLLMSKQKSYQVKAESVEERTLWFNDIAQAAREARVSTGSPELTPEDMSPVWIPDSHVTACEICCKEFSFFFRRHHCRN
ncbi:FGD6, partial [Symbiodinium microadriaticum]